MCLMKTKKKITVKEKADENIEETKDTEETEDEG